jgi:hypothetical protein
MPKRLKLFATEAIAGCSQLLKRNFRDEILRHFQVLLKKLIESELSPEATHLRWEAGSRGLSKL